VPNFHLVCMQLTPCPLLFGASHVLTSLPVAPPGRASLLVTTLVTLRLKVAMLLSPLIS